MAYLVTSALPYVNNVPHLGNVIGSVLSGDVYSRYLRNKGKDVFYLCGTDCYGTTTEVIARKEKMSCREVCEKYHKLHADVYDWFNIKFDTFGTTMTETQTQVTHEIFTELYKRGHIEKREIDQRYCENCELFLADRYLKGTCYKCTEIANGDQCDACGNLLDPLLFEDCWCVNCNTKPIIKKTKHLYLKLADFENQLREHFVNNNNNNNNNNKEKNKVHMTDNALSITKSFLDMGLQSRCITRDLKWGTPVPKLEGLEEFYDKVFYVWFDAPIGYISILKHAVGDDWKKWMNEESQITQFMAKDNVPFHTVIFPATLIGSGIYPMLTALSATEYLDYEGQKFSKSNNTGIFGDTVMQVSDKLGIDADYWRFYLIRIRPEMKDASFNWNEFVAMIKAELCFKIGNLINRCIILSIPKSFEKNSFTYHREFDSELSSKIDELMINYDICFDKFRFRDALNIVISCAEYGNQFIQKNEPWTILAAQSITGLDKFNEIMGYACYIVTLIIKLMEPFMPKKAEALSKNFIFDSVKNVVTVSNVSYSIPFKIIEVPEEFKQQESNNDKKNNKKKQEKISIAKSIN